MTPPKRPIEACAASQLAELAAQSRRVTSYDVALVAGVSQSAVSRCFKPGASVSKSTFARVMKAAALLDYVPNAAARSLITRRTNMVAVLITNRANLYYPELLSELSQQLTPHGKRVLLFPLSGEAEAARVLGDLWQFQVDGVIAAAHLPATAVAEFRRHRVPLVVFNRLLDDPAVHTVSCDHRAAGRMLAARLAAAGHRHFGIITGSKDSVVAVARQQGVAEQLAELGLPAPLVVTGEFDYHSGASGLKTLIARHGGIPDAIICASDVLAIGCLDCARHELGIDVPGQLSVAGLDAVEPSNWLSYNLTTLRQPMAGMAAAAAQQVCQLIERPDLGATRQLFEAQFIEGATARLLPAGAAMGQPFSLAPALAIM
ncbi:LacI family DNA-binding transcriptional regulator [Duganella qianjiadongensis]|uniref:Substrate-binding domain-containing protein n=1 Tax=Duganella qianjiadongensis TaxID=2692176 RepID=A0ABW9VM31_9BURK|nr:LacI family DNA-binding transcriptional regulator [Duganella qianjiadongensis]MYM39534.1 substrate-binding domain-containing protein [Duganella qianjiadongensis]